MRRILLAALVVLVLGAGTVAGTALALDRSKDAGPVLGPAVQVPTTGTQSQTPSRLDLSTALPTSLPPQSATATLATSDVPSAASSESSESEDSEQSTGVETVDPPSATSIDDHGDDDGDDHSDSGGGNSGSDKSGSGGG